MKQLNQRQPYEMEKILRPHTQQARRKHPNCSIQLNPKRKLDADVNVGFRWIDMTTPGGGATLSVIASTDALPTGIDTGIRFITPDARAAHARLVDLGLRVGDLLDWPTAPLMFEFWDLDGNTMYVAEPE